MTGLRPPGGAPPPQIAALADDVIALAPLAERITDRYYEEYPDSTQRYGAAGRAWCVHDNLYLLAWGFGAARGEVRFEQQILWLARVLHARDYPLDRLARDLRIAAEVVVEVHGVPAEPTAAVLREGAVTVERFAAEPPVGDAGAERQRG